MIIGVGIDIVEVDRMGRSLDDKDGLLDEIFTSSEIEYCRKKRFPAEHFAARFCAKEALFKALGEGYRGGMSWREIEIQNDDSGKPQIVISGKVKRLADSLQVGSIFLSISHSRQYAIANVIVESKE